VGARFGEAERAANGRDPAGARLGVEVKQDIDRFLDRALGFHRGLGSAPDLRSEDWQDSKHTS
jgi:hypothetical protein